MKVIQYIALLFILTSCLFISPKQVTFDKIKWQETSHCKPVAKLNIRATMIDSVFKQNFGLDKKAVIGNLGQPDVVAEENTIKYCVGKFYGFSLMWLNLNFENDKLLTYKITSGS